MNSKKRYFSYSDYLQKIFNDRVFKITLNGGFSCPNRDGAISSGGCIFCDATGSFSNSHDANLSVKEQIEEGIKKLSVRHKANKFIGYFQAFSGTYKPIEELKKIYDEVFLNDKVVGLSVATRPDCINDNKLDLIASYPFPQIEYGLQSIHNKTLELINRGHDFKTFEKAYIKTKERDIKVCVHIILGLPEETRSMMLDTAKKLAELKIDGIKIHALTALKGTYVGNNLDKYTFLQEDEYCELVSEILEILPPDVAIHRLAGSGLRSITLAPDWINNKFHTQNLIDEIMWRKDTWQGKKYQA